MLGLLGIGVALILGIGMRVAAVAGALLLVLMWTAVLPPENNPFMDDHLIYAGTHRRPRPHPGGRHDRPREVVGRDGAGQEGAVAEVNT